MSEGKAAKKYKKYIDSLENDIAVSFGVALSVGPDLPSLGRTITLTKKDVASTQNDEHFVLAKVLPALKEALLGMVNEYREHIGQSVESFTSDLLGDKVVKQLDKIGKEVQVELQKQHEMDTNEVVAQHVSTTAKPAKGFIGKQ